MNIDFSSIPETVIPHMRGGEKEFRVRSFSDELCKIMRGRLIPGASLGLHSHDASCEVIYILSGTGRILYDDGCETLGPGSCHSLINDGDRDLEFFAVVPEQ